MKWCIVLTYNFIGLKSEENNLQYKRGSKLLTTLDICRAMGDMNNNLGNYCICAFYMLGIPNLKSATDCRLIVLTGKVQCTVKKGMGVQFQQADSGVGCTCSWTCKKQARIDQYIVLLKVRVSLPQNTQHNMDAAANTFCS